MDIDQFLQKLGIADHPGLRVAKNREGYRDYTFGCRAGPGAATISDLAHELAHAAQFGPRYFKTRARAHGFDFRLRRVWIYNQYCIDQRTTQATCRELDTFAYQAHLMELAGVPFDREDLFKHAADLMTRFMHDWYCVPGDSTEERKAWCIEKAKAYYARRKADTVLRRLNAWLDLTHQHLRKTEEATPLA